MRMRCTYHLRMPKMIQLRHVPDALYRQLKARAANAGLPLSDYLIGALCNIAQKPSIEEMRERLRGRDPYSGEMAPTEHLRAERLD